MKTITKLRGGERGVLQFSLTAADGGPLYPLDTPSPALVLLAGTEVATDGSITAVAPGQHSIAGEHENSKRGSKRHYNEYFLFLVLTQEPWVSHVAVTELNSPQLSGSEDPPLLPEHW